MLQDHMFCEPRQKRDLAKRMDLNTPMRRGTYLICRVFHQFHLLMLNASVSYSNNASKLRNLIGYILKNKIIATYE